MNQAYKNELCSRMLNLDPTIRFAGIIDRKGMLIAGGMKEGLQSLERDEESLKLYLSYAINNIMREDFDSIFGKVLYTVSEREKIKLATFPLGHDILLISMSRDANHDNLIQDIFEILQSRP
ncbi:MAG TPA: DUF6659 family protein [Nitrososphaeraceae archaeon]